MQQSDGSRHTPLSEAVYCSRFERFQLQPAGGSILFVVLWRALSGTTRLFLEQRNATGWCRLAVPMSHLHSAWMTIKVGVEMESRGLAKQLVHISALAVLISTNLAVGASGPPSPPGMSTQAIPSGSFHGVEIPPLWIYDIEAPRDGLHHSGVIVGQDPFTGAGPQEVPTYIVPLVVVVHSMVQTYDPKT